MLAERGRGQGPEHCSADGEGPEQELGAPLSLSDSLQSRSGMSCAGMRPSVLLASWAGTPSLVEAMGQPGCHGALNILCFYGR